MNCPSCRLENPVGAKFCIKCGTSLRKQCPHCQMENLPQANFCMGCGIPLTKETPLIGQQQNKGEAPPPQSPQTERRQVSVMFCDLVGSTALSEQLDPEELQEILLAYRRVSADVIRRNGGQIAQSFGDGLMVYFGYPIAHEDNPQRAIGAGLEIIAQMEQLSTGLMQELGVELNVRIGIHTGKAVVGEMGTGDTYEHMGIVGDTPNIAARIQSIAAPNTVAISAATYRISQGYFECESLGEHTLKGISVPMAVYRVQKEKLLHNRLEAATSGLTPYVGRELELESLVQLWQQVKSGNGQVVLLTGEAGMGKSRLVQVFQERIATDDYNLRELYCSPYYTNSAFYPVIEMVRRQGVQLSREDSTQEQLAKLEQFLVEYELDMAQVVPLFASLLSIPLDERYPPLHLSPAAQKQKTLEVLLAMVRNLVQDSPCLIVIEDLHWVDPSMLELLNLVIEKVSDHRLLLLCTARPTLKSPWKDHKHLRQISLTALIREQTELLVKEIAGGLTLPKQVLELVIAKSDCIPLFVEEMTKMVLESGWLTHAKKAYDLTGQIPDLAIPTTLQDLLMARLDQKETVKQVALLGATIGREFSYELLKAVWPGYEDTLIQGLEQLVNNQLLFMSGELPAAKYLFKHALIQEAAYESLLKSTRKQYHQQIAQVLEQQFPETVEREPEMLAHHYTRAGLNEQAIRYWHLASQKAVKSSAYVEAIGHLTLGLELLLRLPETRWRDQQELDLQLLLSVALRNTKGYAASEVELAYKRSEELCHLLGETPDLFWVRWGLWTFYLGQAKLQTALEVAHQLINLAKGIHDDSLVLEARYALGFTLCYNGELASAHEHLEQAIALDDQQPHHSQIFVTGEDVRVYSLAVASVQLWLSGFPEQALFRSQEAHSLAIELSHPYSLAHALVTGAIFHQYCYERQATQELAEAAIALATEQGFALWLACGTILRGWVLAEAGELESGIAQMCQGLDSYKATGAELLRPYFLAVLAKAYLKADLLEVGIGVLTEALEAVEKTGERFWEAELYRLQGEHLRAKLQRTSAKETEAQVEECFRQALDISRRQGAKSLELRAAMSLARLWQQQSQTEQARQLLFEIYSWFTEGFDTADLKDAKALLTELS